MSFRETLPTPKGDGILHIKPDLSAASLSTSPRRADRHHARFDDGELTSCDDFEVKSAKQLGFSVSSAKRLKLTDPEPSWTPPFCKNNRGRNTRNDAGPKVRPSTALLFYIRLFRGKTQVDDLRNRLFKRGTQPRSTSSA